MSTYNLTFDDTDYQRNNDSQRTRFINYLYRVLFHHRVDIASFYIRQSLERNNDKEYYLESWLNAIKEIVARLDMDITLPFESNFRLPLSILSDSPLGYLAAKFQNGFVKIPSFISAFNNLKTLKLQSVQIDESFGQWISSVHLSYLQLRRFKGTMQIKIASYSYKLPTYFYIDSFHKIYNDSS